mmetsp:Transcript_14435/g.22546  ORF Transcript_14435/g.22546 Transcript_14435/m.22546 type:complete len:454 (+) Transcript_14435:93-1454(+)
MVWFFPKGISYVCLYQTLLLWSRPHPTISSNHCHTHILAFSSSIHTPARRTKIMSVANHNDNHNDNIMDPTSSSTLPATMRAAQGKDYGDIEEMMSVQDGIVVPQLKDCVDPKQQHQYLVLRTLSVSLAPGDCRVLSGKTRELQGPPSFPYIPCGDCSGIVVEVPPPQKKKKKDDESYFQVGDRVAVRFAEGPRDALAEYALVRQDVCEKILDTSLSSEDAAALASASPATSLADRLVPGERVLVLGAGGGVGSHLCQLARTTRDVAYIVGVGKDTDRLVRPPISCHDAFDYTNQAQDPWWSTVEWQDQPFDVVVDLAGGAWEKLQQQAKHGEKMIVKPASQGGRLLTLVPAGPIFEMHSIWSALQAFLVSPLWRAFRTRTWSRSVLPAYTFAMSLDSDRGVMTRTLQLAKEGKLQACIDEIFPFTTEGVRKAFKRQESRHAHGKVIVQVASK